MKNILRPFRAFALVALSILAGIGAANGATLYVATTGSNATGNGSLNNPWATIQFAINNAAFTPGSEIIVQDGQYAPFYVDKSGSTAALRYTIRAAGSNARIFDTVVYDGRPASIHVSRSYVTIDGFIVDANKTVGDSDGVRSRGIRVSGLPTAHVIDVRILNNKVSNAGWVGISTSYAQDVLIEGNEISNSKGQHGLYVANSADGPIIRRNVSHHNAWAGIQINADPETTEDDPVDGIITNALVEQNISYSNGIGGTGTVGGNPNTGGGGSFDFASIRNSRIINNLSYDNQRQGIVLWDDGYGDAFGSKNNLIANNTVVMPAGTGHAFSIRNGSTGNTVRNNILIHLDSSNNDSIAIDPESLTGTFVSNYNIVTRFEDTGGNIVNLVTWRSQTGQDANSFTGTTSIFTNFAARDFTLASGSAAINAGTTVALVTTDILGTARPQGAGYDIGAYERVTVVAMPPGAPTIGTATRGNGQATVSFTPPASNGGATITSYTVTCTPGAGSFTGSGAGSPVVVTGLTNGTAYNCSVTATNSAGTGPASGTVSVTPATVPGTPSIASATPGNGTATITINAPASNGGSALLGYTVVCSAPGQTTQTLIGTPSPAVVSNLANGATYSCTAAAINDVGTGAASTAASVTPVGPPGAPLSVSATASPGQISVSFSPPSSNGGSAITSYNATCGAQSASGSNSPIVVAGIAPGTTASCTVTATNAQGTGAPSAPSNSVTLPNVPSAPVFLNGIVGDGQIVAVFQPSSSNGGSPITGYTVQCASNPLPTQTGTGGGSPITVTGMTNGAVYSCGVIASNAVGNSPPSNLLSLMPSDMAPLTLVSVQSRKTHGSAGNFDLAIDMQALIGGAITVEPRAIGAGHSLVFQFNNTITATGNASAVDAALATIGSTNVSAAGNEVTISLTGVPDNRRATISLTNVNGLSNSFSVSMGFLVGDVGSSRTVNGQDISAVKGRAGQVADASNFRFDLNASGAINASDIAAVRKRIGLSLP